MDGKARLSSKGNKDTQVYRQRWAGIQTHSPLGNHQPLQLVLGWFVDVWLLPRHPIHNQLATTHLHFIACGKQCGGRERAARRLSAGGKVASGRLLALMASGTMVCLDKPGTEPHTRNRLATTMTAVSVRQVRQPK